MIAWKAKYGYLESPYAPTNISQINFTDEGPFTILTGPYNFPDNFTFAANTQSISATATPKQSFDTTVALSYGLQSLLGDDFNFIYPVASRPDPRYDVPNPYAQLQYCIPSSTKACSNLYSYFEEHYMQLSSYTFSYIYIPALSKVIRGGTIFDVSSDGKLTQIFYASSNAPYGPNNANGILGNAAYRFYGTYLMTNSYDGTSESIIKGEQYFLQFIVGGGYAYTINKSDYSKSNVSSQFYESLFKNYVEPDFKIPTNPFEPLDPSGPTDPELPPGTFDDTSDPIPMSPLPTLSSANTGFTRIYNPTLSQVQELAKYLWTDDTVIETIWNHIKQFFEDPMEAIIGFNLVPVPVPDGGTKNFALMFIDTGVEMTVAASQFVDVDCGSVKVERYYGSALDQSPNTKVSCFLPFIGMVQFNTDEVMGATLNIVYRVDVVSGSCVAHVLVDGNAIYQYSGHCAIPIPFNSADFSNYVSSAISVAKLAVGAAVGGAAGVGAVAAEDAEQQTSHTVTKTTNVKETKRNPETGRQITSKTRTKIETIETPVESESTQASYAGLSPQNVSNTVGQIMGSKPHIQHSGSFSGNTGYLGVRRPFLIIERPNMCLPENYQTLNGFPSMITMLLSSCKGYTRVQQVQLTGMTATNPEQAEILQLLKSGVVF